MWGNARRALVGAANRASVLGSGLREEAVIRGRTMGGGGWEVELSEDPNKDDAVDDDDDDDDDVLLETRLISGRRSGLPSWKRGWK